LKSNCFGISSQVTFVLLAKKKRQCDSKKFTQGKATVELPKQDREQQLQESKGQRKQRA
jgi:hypothetical protein